MCVVVVVVVVEGGTHGASRRRCHNIGIPFRDRRHLNCGGGGGRRGLGRGPRLGLVPEVLSDAVDGPDPAVTAQTQHRHSTVTARHSAATAQSQHSHSTATAQSQRSHSTGRVIIMSKLPYAMLPAAITTAPTSCKEKKHQKPKRRKKENGPKTRRIHIGKQSPISGTISTRPR